VNYHAGVVVWKQICAAVYYCDLWRRACNSKPRWRTWSSTRFLWQQSRPSNILVARAKVSTTSIPCPVSKEMVYCFGGRRAENWTEPRHLGTGTGSILPFAFWKLSQHPWMGSSFPGPHVQSSAVSLSSEANDLGLQAGALRKALLRCIASCQSTSLFLMTPRL
jgi:hypothetical protein